LPGGCSAAAVNGKPCTAAATEPAGDTDTDQIAQLPLNNGSPTHQLVE